MVAITLRVMIGKNNSEVIFESSLGIGNAQVPTNLLRQNVGNLDVTGHGFNGARRRIRPQRMRTPLALKMTAVLAEMPQ
jgi:hypothetical protein